MRIKNISDLIEGQKYWHLFVENDCHWKIKKKSSTYKSNENWSNMIIFDNEKEAKEEAIRLQVIVNKLIIR